MTRSITTRSTLMTALIGAAAAASLFTGLGTTPASAGYVYGGGIVISIGHACPWGTHLGYEGKYCWPNQGYGYGHICPPGTHLGYEGKYCWRNHY